MNSMRIVNGLVVDGTGKPAFHGEVAIEGDRIVSVEPLAPAADLSS